MSIIRALTTEQFEREYQGVGKETIKCDFCGERNMQFTVTHEGILMTEFYGTDAKTHIYMFCGLCFFHNIGHFLRMLHEKV